MSSSKTEPSFIRKCTATFVALLVFITFMFIVSVIIEARLKSFYGEPLLEKVAYILDIRLNGIPDDAEKRARVITAIPSLFLLPPEAVLPKAPADRFKRIGTEFGYVVEDTKLGTKFECHASKIKRIPTIALNVAIGLESFPEDLLRRVQMDYIVFCGDLITNVGSVGGFPAPPNNVMFLNLNQRTTDRDVKYLFFHEFYHLFEYRFNLINDPKWMEDFPSGYKDTYNGMTNPEYNPIGSGGSGFMNYYSRSHPHEDRAEIFAMLMTSKAKLIRHIVRNKDYMLAAKTEYVAKQAKDYLDIDFGPLWKKRSQRTNN